MTKPFQFLVLEGKHSESRFPANTEDEKALASLAILKINSDYYWRPDKNEFTLNLSQQDQDYLALTEEEISNLPESIRTTVTERIAVLRKRQARADASFEAANTFCDRVDMLLEQPIEKAIKYEIGEGRFKERLAYRLVMDRCDHQYEHVFMEYLDDPMKVLEG